jgi:hypothetical protein
MEAYMVKGIRLLYLFNSLEIAMIILLQNSSIPGTTLCFAKAQAFVDIIVN